MEKQKHIPHYFRALLVAVAVLVFSGAVLAEEQVKPTASFYFVQITDTHLDDGDNFERTRKAVEQINALSMPIKCVIHTGDITYEKTEDESVVMKGLAILRELKVPIHFVPGNHDILRSRYAITRDAYIKYFGSLVTEVEYDGVVFIMIYTEPLSESFSLDAYAPISELEAGLKRANEKPVIVFQHAPAVSGFFNNTMRAGWKKEIREKWESVLNAYNVKAVIAGHFHRDEHHWHGKVPLYVSAPISGAWGRQASFRVYEYKDGKVGYRTLYIK